MPRFVMIAHPDGREYAVTVADFKSGADEQFRGFKITTYEGGDEYDGPKTAAAVVKAQDAPRATEKAADGKKDGGE